MGLGAPEVLIVISMLIPVAVLVLLCVWLVKRRGTSRTPGPVATPAGWYADPFDPDQLRWWDGSAWTESMAQRT
jgi:Protein of unknown function (DUF2510)